MVTRPGFQGVQAFQPNADEHRRRIAEVLNNVLQGKLNATLDVTLRASQTTTVVTDARLGPFSVILPMARTASAAGNLDGLYVTDQGKGTATLHHDSISSTDQDVRLLIIG